MKDIQSQHDERQIDIDQVGVSGLRHPIIVRDQVQEKQSTVATLSMSVDLPHHFKGTHMSRFIEILNEHHGEVTMWTIPKILHALKAKLEAESAHIEFSFPYFVEREAPASKARALMDYQCSFIGSSNNEKDDFILGVTVPVTSLCPCSKAISDYGAHNQRGEISIEVRTSKDEEGMEQFVWIEELIEVAEQSASAPVYALLKRQDERHVTMQAYDNPVFVEDMVRNVAQHLKTDPRIAWFRVHVVNHESIHNHGAFAKIEWPKC
jgi:GTP cyclohydrolase I